MGEPTLAHTTSSPTARPDERPAVWPTPVQIKAAQMLVDRYRRGIDKDKPVPDIFELAEIEPGGPWYI